MLLKNCLFFIFFRFRYPYDWKMPVAYVFTMLLQASQFMIPFSTVFLFLSLFAGCCQFLIASIQDIKEHWLELSEDVKNKPKLVTIQKRIKMKEKLHQILQFHGDIEELAIDSLLKIFSNPFNIF